MRTKLNFSQDRLKELNNKLNSTSPFYEELAAYSSQLKSDPSQINSLLPKALRAIVDFLSIEKAPFLAPITLDEAKCFVRSYESRERADWEAGLLKGLNEKDWTDLITHPTLRDAQIKTESLNVSFENQEAVMQAWKAKYLGTSHRSLLQAIDKLNNQHPATYAKIIAMIQSSGTGKSKTMDEIAKERVLFPLCLREGVGANYYAYPPVDKAVRDYLLRPPSPAYEGRCKSFLRGFLISLFSQALIQAETFMGTEKTSYLTLAKMFYQLFSEPSRRNIFYRNVIENASSVNNTSLVSTVQSLKKALLRCTDLPKEGCLILFGIDEVHVFFQQRKYDVRSDHTIFSRLKSVFSEVVVEPICFVVLSTEGAVSQLAPSPEVAPTIHDRILPMPFTELPFDIDIISDPLVPGRETLSSVGLLKFAARFGRPLFFAHYKSRSSQGVHDGTIAVQYLDIIREKLCSFRWPPRRRADALDPSSFAVLSARLLLDLSPTTPHVRKFEENQVRAHLRMLYSAIQDRGAIVTGSSPEPLIAEASAQVMNYVMEDRSRYMDVWALLNDFIKEGLIAQDNVGDLIGRVLSVLAMDHAIGAQDRSELKYQAPVTVAAYYKALLIDAAWDILRQSVPENARELTETDSTNTFEEAFDDTYVHFSHYGKSNDDTPPTDRYSWALWLRGTAILCRLNKSLTDRAIPIYFSKLGGVGPETVSLVLDQDKTGESVDPRLVSRQSAEDLGIFTSGNGLPYIDAVHCYALSKPEIRVGTAPHRRHPLSNREAPRYRIEISGLAAYRLITEHDANIIWGMIDDSRNALFNNHLAKSRLPLLQQQLPMLNGSPASTAWFGGFKER